MRSAWLDKIVINRIADYGSGVAVGSQAQTLQRSDIVVPPFAGRCPPTSCAARATPRGLRRFSAQVKAPIAPREVERGARGTGQVASHLDDVAASGSGLSGKGA